MAETSSARLRLLIDACLTPAAISHLTRVFGDRVSATHVDRVLGPGTSDEAVLTWAAGERRMVLTANDVDYLVLARAGAPHCGLGLINDQNTRVRQIAAIERLVGALLGHIDDGGVIAGHVFVLRRTGRLSVRRILL